MAQQTQQQPSPALTVVVAALTALLVGKFLAVQTELVTKFAKLIAVYGVGDLLLMQMRKVARAAAVQLQTEVPPLVEQIISEAVAEGAAAGAVASGSGGTVPPVTDHPPGWFDPHMSHAEMSAQAIRDDLNGKLNQLGYRITRYADDVYRSVTPQASIGQVLGALPKAAQQQAYNDLISRGVTGYTDANNRNWSLSAYVEMAVRTSSQRAYNVSHLARMQSLGIDLFTVTDDGHPCPLCAPWQGKILSAEPDSRADATIADATGAGLFHPNCKHTLVAYFPGVTDIPTPHEWSAEDQTRYDNTQKQRALERDIRAAKLQLAGAYDPEMRHQAEQKVRLAQQRMRDFIGLTGLNRNTRREQLNLGLK
jgi:hypothetical protein